MRFCCAKKLHTGDEVVHKVSGDIMYVVAVNVVYESEKPYVEITTEDGSVFHHTDIK